MTLAEREKLVAMAREQDFLIVQDSPYRELRYSGEPVQTIYSTGPRIQPRRKPGAKILEKLPRCRVLSGARE